MLQDTTMSIDMLQKTADTLQHVTRVQITPTCYNRLQLTIHIQYYKRLQSMSNTIEETTNGHIFVRRDCHYPPISYKRLVMTMDMSQ